MFKINIKKIAVFFTALCLGALVVVPALAATYDCTSNCAAITEATEKSDCISQQTTLKCSSANTATGAFDPWGEQSGGIESIGLGGNNPSSIAVTIVNIMLGFLGIVAVVIILIGGFKWMTAGGNEDQVGEAKKWIYSGVIGLLIILAAYGLAKFAITQLYKATGGTATF